MDEIENKALEASSNKQVDEIIKFEITRGELELLYTSLVSTVMDCKSRLNQISKQKEEELSEDISMEAMACMMVASESIKMIEKLKPMLESTQPVGSN